MSYFIIGPPHIAPGRAGYGTGDDSLAATGNLHMLNYDHLLTTAPHLL